MKICLENLELELARACASLSDLRESGVSSATLARIKKQPEQEFSPKTIGKLARALQVPVEKIIKQEATTL